MGHPVYSYTGERATITDTDRRVEECFIYCAFSDDGPVRRLHFKTLL
jgi:hypothetical protein